MVFGAFRGIFRGDLLDEKFLMTVASGGAFALGDFSEAAAVMIFYQIGEYFQARAVRRSRDSVKALMDICPDEANLVENGVERKVDASDLTPGQTVVIRSGERVPADCRVTSGGADVDSSALTGESEPCPAGEGSELRSGSVVISGALVCEVLRPAGESAAARILELVENASDRKSKDEKFISSFARVYTPAVVAGALLLAVVPPLFGLSAWGESIRRALVFLVVSCPCALILSVPLAFFGGIGRAASAGILFKGGHAFSPVAKADTFVFDKTGTLTDGKLSIADVTVADGSPVSKEELLSLAASAEYPSIHPVAICLKEASPDSAEPSDCREIPGKGCVATVGDRTVAVGNAALMDYTGTAMPDPLPAGVYAAVDGVFAGAIRFSDSVKPEAKGAIEELRRLGVSRTVILSGDSRDKAEAVGSELSVDRVESGLLPEEKHRTLELIMDGSAAGTVYVGDGINDAPSLVRADAGVAMGGIGSDSAIESADLVIVSDSLAKLPEAVRIARKTLRIARENIVLALAVKGAVLVLGALGFAGMWAAVFADVGVAVICVLNSMRTLLK